MAYAQYGFLPGTNALDDPLTSTCLLSTSILITTKKGYASKPTIAYNGAFGVSTLANKPNLLTADQWRSYTSSTPGKDGKDFDMGANTDWFDEITSCLLYTSGLTCHHTHLKQVLHEYIRT